MRAALTIFIFLPTFAAAGFPFTISENPGSEPAVAALSDSTAVVVYEAGDQAVFTIPGEVAESPLVPSGTESGSAPDVAALSDSGFVAVWLADDGAVVRPVARLFDPEGMPTTDLLEIGGSGNAADIAVAAAAGGGFVVTWSKFWPPGLENVFVRAFDSAGQPTTAELRASGDEEVHNVHSHVAAAPDGSFTVTWGTFTTLVSTCRARRHSGAGGSWDDSWLVAENAAYLAVASDAGGNIQLAWAETVGKQGVQGQRLGEVPVLYGGSDAGPVGSAMHPAGSAVVVWHEGGIGAPGRLRARFLDRQGQPTGEVVPVAENVAGTGNSPGVSVSATGLVIFVWVDQGTGLVHGNWWDEPLVPVAVRGWGSVKSAWR